MREINGQLWEYYGATGYCETCDAPFPEKRNLCARNHIAIETVVVDAKFQLCITTNGTVKANGACVMGRGCANEAKLRFPGIDRDLGQLIRQHGNIMHELPLATSPLLSFPVKHNWWEQADLSLIRESAGKLWIYADEEPQKIFILPRPGCGNGHLTWEQVKPVVEFLPDNVWVISF